MNLGDPELELVDPTPNVHTLFIHFDKLFFWTKLASRAVVRWSKRMYSCAGVCSYEGRGGLCDIALSEPLLKLRPRKDLIETLLHEMIHAFLFVTNRDQDRDGHGPNFKSHMYRINQSAGLNISIYHDFHDEVKLYQTHWWRCDGPCQTRKPHFGIVRRSANRAPGPNDCWWLSHKRNCGGTFVKIKEPEKKQPAKKKETKANGDITKYINNNNNKTTNISGKGTGGPLKPVLKDSSNIPNKSNVKTKSNSSSTLVVTKKGVVTFNPTKPPSEPIPVFTGNGFILSNNINGSNIANITETVRSIWANKQLPSSTFSEDSNKAVKTKATKDLKPVMPTKPNKHKADPNNLKSPPAKIKKIDDYFKASATSVLKDLYGEDIRLTQSNNSNKLVAVSAKTNLVDCPVCHSKISSEEINRHLDECLNKDVIEKLSKDSITDVQDIKPSQSNVDNSKLREIVGHLPPIPAFKAEKVVTNNNVIDLTNLNKFQPIPSNKNKRKIETEAGLQCVDMDLVNLIAKDIKKEDDTINLLDALLEETKPNKRDEKNTRKSISFINTQRGESVPIKIKKEEVVIKSEPGTSKAEFDTFNKICPCCGKKFDKPINEHLDECLTFFDNNNTLPEEGASTSFNNSTIVIDDDEDDVFDETLVLNATGTKTPCPCCMRMVEQAEMNDHLDVCLQ